MHSLSGDLQFFSVSWKFSSGDILLFGVPFTEIYLRAVVILESSLELIILGTGRFFKPVSDLAQTHFSFTGAGHWEKITFYLPPRPVGKINSHLPAQPGPLVQGYTKVHYSLWAEFLKVLFNIVQLH